MSAGRLMRDSDHSVARRRAQLVVQCATELLRAQGVDPGDSGRFAVPRALGNDSGHDNHQAHGNRNGDDAATSATYADDADLPGAPPALRLDLTVAEFQAIFQQRFGSSFPSLTNRSESSLERARLERRDEWALPKVLLRRGAPPGRGLRRDKN